MRRSCLCSPSGCSCRRGRCGCSRARAAGGRRRPRRRRDADAAQARPRRDVGAAHRDLRRRGDRRGPERRGRIGGLVGGRRRLRPARALGRGLRRRPRISPLSACVKPVYGRLSTRQAAAAPTRLRPDMTERIAAAGRELSPASAFGSAQLRVAVLDTDSGFLQVLGKRLERLGWEHRVLASPVPIDTVVAMRLNAIVIDLAVLGPQAWDYLEKLCSSLPGLGAIVCTGQSTGAQRVRGLRRGADDGLTKPCHPGELLARLGAVVRRRGRAEGRDERPPIHAGAVEIRADRFQAYVAEQSVDLTRREFELIELLAGAEGRVLEREEIYQRVWGYAMARGDRSVDVFVRKLRQKLEKASPGWRYIHTHFGVGYRFAPEPAVGEGTAPEPVLDALPAAERSGASAEAGSAAASAVLR